MFFAARIHEYTQNIHQSVALVTGLQCFVGKPRACRSAATWCSSVAYRACKFCRPRIWSHLWPVPARVASTLGHNVYSLPDSSVITFVQCDTKFARKCDVTPIMESPVLYPGGPSQTKFPSPPAHQEFLFSNASSWFGSMESVMG